MPLKWTAVLLGLSWGNLEGGCLEIDDVTSPEALNLDDECLAGDLGCAVSELQLASRTRQACQDAVPGDACWKATGWAKSDGIYGHPEWYPGLTPQSSYADFQAAVHRSRPATCPLPCSTGGSSESSPPGASVGGPPGLTAEGFITNRGVKAFSWTRRKASASRQLSLAFDHGWPSPFDLSLAAVADFIERDLQPNPHSVAMPAAPVPATTVGHSPDEWAQLHREGWMRLKDGMPEWELVTFIERLYRRYDKRLKDFLERHRKDWPLADEGGSGPGAHRLGGLSAAMATASLEGSGLYVYAAHPSQPDEEEEEDIYTGPRWYVSCMEAAMRRYSHRCMAPPPPADMQELLWPELRDRCRPWLTEAGWTIVPENSDPQVLHADICSWEGDNPRKVQLGRYHHFAWKLDRKDHCTTHVVPEAFTEGSVEGRHYKELRAVRAPAIIFDSEVLHRGGPTPAGVGWTSTLTIQVSSGSGWSHLPERVSESLMWYTQPLGWVVGDAVDALVDGIWEPGLVASRSDAGLYSVSLWAGAAGEVVVHGLRDQDLRYRQPQSGAAPAHGVFGIGQHVEALFEGNWHLARVSWRNADGTYRVTWRKERSCTDGLAEGQLRALGSPSSDGEDVASSSQKRRRKDQPDEQPQLEGMRQLRQNLLVRGCVELAGGLPTSWSWEVFNFVEQFHDAYHKLIVQELDSLRGFWAPCEGSGQRHGAFAAWQVSQRLRPYGLAVYSPGQSQSEQPPHQSTGPRWYVSVTPAAISHFSNAAPPPPPELYEALFGHPADSTGWLRARGLGWTLAPPGSDPQAMHADIWGVGKHARTDRTRWPHILWKRSRKEYCTTQVVPGAFTEGDVQDVHFEQLTQVRAPAVVLDSEMLHRGAPTKPAAPAETAPAGWVSSLSLELCSPSGWAAWEAYDTGGTVKDPSSPLDWRMLRIHQPSDSCRRRPPPELSVSTPRLPAAPWEREGGMEELRREQACWEFNGEEC